MIREIELSLFYLVNMAKIDKAELIKMVNENKSNKAIMERFGCSLAAVASAKIRIKKSFRAPVIQKPNELSKDNIDVMAQLNHVNQIIMGLLARGQKLVLREESKMEKYDNLVAEIEKEENEERKKALQQELFLIPDNTKSILKIQDNLINISKEIRGHIELQKDIAETLYNLQMTADFQNEVIAGIREVDPITAKKIIDNLRAKRALKGLIKQ